eukprot:1159352-Pelagomonas_calceolata.AAC.4
MSGEVFLEDTDGSAIGVDVGESSGTKQYGGTCKQMPAFVWYLWPSPQLRCRASCNASSVQAIWLYRVQFTPQAEKLQGVLKGSAGFLAPEQEQQQQQQQEASTSNTRCATGQLAARLLSHDDGSLLLIFERVNFWHMGAKKDFPVLAVHALYRLTVCASERNWSAWGQLYTKRPSRLDLERARKLIYVCCNSKQFIEDDLEASLQLHEEESK